MSYHHVEVRAGAYADSVRLLEVSRNVSRLEEVETAQVAMATPLNLDVLRQLGFDVPPCSPNDMVVALRLSDESVLPSVLAAVADALTTRRPAEGVETQAPHRTTAAALSSNQDPSAIVLVSVPGASALPEAMDALDAGYDVMIFSDNVPIAHEVALKRVAADRGRLVMGPDCGTALVQGVGLGFANATSPGPVGLVAASGTGCQQLLALFDHAGVGVGTAWGVGGRDLTAEVGGSSAREALRRLDDSPEVELVVVVSKPPAPEVATAIQEYAASLGTPVQFALLGAGQPDLTVAAETALRALGRAVPDWPTWGHVDVAAPGELIRGLFVGGTLCDEAMLIASSALGSVWSNIPLSPELAVDGDLDADGHVFLDFGDDALTQGRAHPMIDPGLRTEHLRRVAADPRTGVLLLDVVLGYAAEPDPAANLAPVIAAISDRIPVVVACVGTRSDPQDLGRQAEAFAAAGAEVHLSNAAAARHVAELVGEGR